MAEFEGQEKSEQPTSKKLDDARNKGQVAKSMEVNSLAVFATGLMLVFAFQSFIAGRIKTFTISIFSSLDVLKNGLPLITSFTYDWVVFFLLTVLPIFIGIVLVSLFVNISQVGFNFSTKALAIKFDKLNPVSGFKRIFSSRSVVELLKSLFKFIVVGGFAYIVLDGLISTSTGLESLSISEILVFMLESAFSLLWKISLVYAVIAGADFVYQKYKFKKDMMMSKQEVKEEIKQTEGDPIVKSKIKQMQFMAAKNRMMKNLPKADVVITNPTHFAVALKYDMLKDPAPEVIAKGMDELAQKIKEVAKQHDIPLHEDRELARALFKMCDVGDKIPAALFKSVAQVLAYVYNLKKTKKKKSIV